MATRIDHTNCGHPKTPAGRAMCRNLRKQENATAEQIMATTAGDECMYCRKHVWYDDILPGYFHKTKYSNEDPFQCKSETHPDKGQMYTFHDVR